MTYATVLLSTLLLFTLTLSSDKATSLINKPQKHKKKYHNPKHEKLKSKQTCEATIHCNETITLDPSASMVTCIQPSSNTDQLLLSTPIDNFGALTADIIDGSYTQNIFIAPNSNKYLTKYYGFDTYNYYTNMTIPLRFITPSINISHSITVDCMKCDQNICGQTITSNNGESKHFCIQTHINTDNPTYISQFVFVCETGNCVVNVYDYMNELEFRAFIDSDTREKQMEFKGFNVGEAYSIEFYGFKSENNVSALRIECSDPLLHSANYNKEEESAGYKLDSAQKLIVLISMVGVMAVVTVFYLLQKWHTSRPMNSLNTWDDL